MKERKLTQLLTPDNTTDLFLGLCINYIGYIEMNYWMTEWVRTWKEATVAYLKWFTSVILTTSLSKIHFNIILPLMVNIG